MFHHRLTSYIVSLLDKLANLLANISDLYWTKIKTQHVKCWSNVSWAEIKDPRNVPKSLFLSNVVHKCVYIPVSEHLSFAKIIHAPNRCSISKSRLNNMIIRHRCTLCWGQLKATLKCGVLSHNTMPLMSQVLGEHEIGMLTAGNVHQSCCYRIEC